MKKPAVVSVVVLALLSFAATSAFADPSVSPPSPATTSPAPAKPRPKKARKAAPRIAVPKKVGAPAPGAAAAPAAPDVEVAHSEPPAAPAPVAVPEPAAPAPRDEPAASRSASDGEAKPFAAAPLIGYASQGLKLGFGARATYSFSNHVSVSGTFVYHLGRSEEAPSFGGATAETSVRAFYPAVEAGYDLRLDSVVIRPYAGVGALFITASQKVGDSESSDTKGHFAIYPGVTGTYDIPQTSLFAGADMRLLIVTDGGDPSFGFFGTFGLRL